MNFEASPKPGPTGQGFSGEMWDAGCGMQGVGCGKWDTLNLS